MCMTHIHSKLFNTIVHFLSGGWRLFLSMCYIPKGDQGMLLLFSHSVMSNSLRPHGLQQARLPCSSQSPRVYSNSCPLSQWCHPTILSSVAPFSSCPQFCPATWFFPMSPLFTSGGQNIGASALVIPMNIQGWFPSRLTGLISLLFKRLSRVFSNTTAWKYQFFGPQPLLQSNSHIYAWMLEKPCSFDYIDLCWLIDVSAFEHAV